MTQQKPVTSLYRRLEAIGRGNFGVVYKGVNLETKQVVAIKVLNLDTVEDEVLDVQHEIAVLSQLSQSDAHNITKYYGSYLYGTRLWIIMDLCAGGSVRTLLKPGAIEEKYIAVLARELLTALVYIHKEGIIHRDIKAANVLITKEGRVRLCDFGVAAEITTNKLKRSTIVGTPYWMAPEVITEGALYNTKADIWSLGVTIYEIATGNPPYADQEAMRAIMLIPRQKPARLEGSQYSPALKDFVAQCLDENPNERPSAEELMKHKFIKQSRNTPTTYVRDLVSRYMSWKHRNQHVRDSIAIFNHKIASDEDFSDEDDNEDSMEDAVWDFDIDEEHPDDEVASGGTEGLKDVSYSNQNTLLPQQFNEPLTNAAALDAMTSHSELNTNSVATNLGGVSADAPQSLLELFEDENDVPTAPVPDPMLVNHSLMPPSGHSVVPRGLGVQGMGMAGMGGPQGLSGPQGLGSQIQLGQSSMPSTPTVEIEIPSFSDLPHAKPPQAPATAPTSAVNSPKLSQNPPLHAPPSIHMPQLSTTTSFSGANSSGTVMGDHSTMSQNSMSSSTPSLASTSMSIRRAPPPPLSSAPPHLVHNSPPAILPPTAAQQAMQMAPQVAAQMAAHRRTPSPKRMQPKTVSGNPSPPKLIAASAMKPLQRSNNSSTVLISSSDEFQNSTAPIGNAISQPQSTKRQINRRPGPALNRGNLRIAMPPALPLPSLQALSTPHASSSSAATSTDDSDTAPIDDRNHNFPAIPKIDMSVLLDSALHEDVVTQLNTVLTAYLDGLHSLGDALGKMPLQT
jgi:protein-serine/threonine kinase